MKNLKNIAIIPARGGSKRIPRKNIKDFLGKPIISYSIEVAINSGLFDEVMVSTDDKEIASIAKEYGAKVPFMRSKENADDYATLADVIEEVKLHYDQKQDHFDNICCILATAPLMTANLLIEGYRELNINEIDSVRPVVRYSYPIQRALKMKEGKISFFYNEFVKTRSQDLETSFHDAGMFYWMKFQSGLLGKNKYAFEISELHTQDIDTLEDWKMAEYKYEYLLKQSISK